MASEVVRVEHVAEVYSASFSPDGSYIVTSSWDTVRLTRVSDGAEVVRVEHGDIVTGAIFSPDGSYIVSISLDSTARVTRVSDGAEVVRVEHGGSVYSASLQSRWPLHRQQ